MIVVVGLNHETAPVAVREALAFPKEGLPEALARVREEAGLGEAVILSTCNRVEVYGRSSRFVRSTRWRPSSRATTRAASRTSPPTSTGSRARRRCATRSAWRPASTRW